MPDAIAATAPAPTSTPTTIPRRRSILPAWMGAKVIATVWLVLVAYGTLVPFEFEPMPEFSGAGGFFAWLFALLTCPTWITSDPTDISIPGHAQLDYRPGTELRTLRPTRSVPAHRRVAKRQNLAAPDRPRCPDRPDGHLDPRMHPEPDEVPHRFAGRHPYQHSRRPLREPWSQSRHAKPASG